ncbi:MAG: hypothetical protein G3M70_02285 [Candidatus Nitronauta litoralis]|uniref:Uncharacterized protein n=1 Tax=Candidatus Nitronauta litoralis TaxID=2705533 RepID=A0A7T0BTT3_9BACT|nr:MAG: hypothetical protein G3M70_02285 [Candidatus Nitronauta litoralis]
MHYTFRMGFLSIAKTRQGGVEFAAPAMAMDALKAALLPSHVYRGVNASMDDVVNMGLEVAGGGCCPAR